MSSFKSLPEPRRRAPGHRIETGASTAWAGLCLALVMLAAATGAHALGTDAGTDINNAAQVSYQLGATPVSATSNTVTITVAEIVDVTVTLQSPQTPVDVNTTNQELLFTVTNTGNGDETFTLAIDSVLGGDDFDPVPSVTSIFFDTDGSGDLSSGDTPYAPGSNDPLLAADASIAVFIVNDIPAGPANGQIGLSQLAAESTTGIGTPGTVLTGAGTGGVDAIIGNSGGQADASGEYLVSTLNVAIVKSASVSDPFSGSEPVPGAEVTYRIEVTATGSGTGTAATVTDPVPANTTYVPGSITLNSTALTDAPDSDAGLFVTATNQVEVQIGNLTTASGTQVVEFRVVID